MGRFYTNVTVKHADAVGLSIAPLSRYAIITPPVNGHVMVYDRESERQDGTIADFARQLSEELNTKTFAVMNHDDSVLYYWLFDSGEEIDQYNSRPSYFDTSDQPQGGDVDILVNAFGRPNARDQVEQILHCDADGEIEDSPYVFETDRHADLVGALHLPKWAVGYGYNYLAEDDFPEGFPADDTFYTETDEDA